MSTGPGGLLETALAVWRASVAGLEDAVDDRAEREQAVFEAEQAVHAAVEALAAPLAGVPARLGALGARLADEDLRETLADACEAARIALEGLGVEPFDQVGDPDPVAETAQLTQLLAGALLVLDPAWDALEALADHAALERERRAGVGELAAAEHASREDAQALAATFDALGSALATVEEVADALRSGPTGR